MCVEKWKQIKVFCVVYWKTSKKRPKKIKDAVIEAKPVAAQLQLIYSQWNNILIRQLKKKIINSLEIFPIVYSLLSLVIILSISITLHFLNWLSSMLLGQSSILSLSSASCIMHCIIFHIIFYGFLNKEAPTFKSINNINKCIKYPFPIIFKYKIKNNF